jgi:hypothetical protein
LWGALITNTNTKNPNSDHHFNVTLMTHSKKVSKDNNISLDFYQQIGEEYKVAYLGENSFV